MYLLSVTFVSKTTIVPLYADKRHLNNGFTSCSEIDKKKVSTLFCGKVYIVNNILSIHFVKLFNIC